MKRSRLIGLGLVGMALLAISAVMIWQQASHTNSAEGAIALQRPLFADTAYAGENDTSAIGEKLDDEAGISAYFKSSSAINLNDVRDQFTTIEAETNNYIIGSVSIPGYAEVYDVHVYVNKNGWMMTYYLKEDPAAKIVDVISASLDSNLLVVAMNLMASKAGIVVGNVSYYDFRFPNATNLLLVSEDRSNGQDFYLTMPNTFGYFERSWATDIDGYLDIRLNNEDLDHTALHAEYRETGYGILDSSMMLPNVRHHIDSDEIYTTIAIVYRVP